MSRLSNAKCIQAMQDEVIFTNNSSTLVGATTFRGWGNLPEDERDVDVENVDYWLYSYETPIAWVHADDSIVVPRHTYSATSTSHQRMVAEAYNLDWPPPKR